MMKKVIIAILAFAVLATGVMFAVAQRSGDGKKGGWGKRGGHHRGGMMLRGLDLTDDQKAKVKEIMGASKAKAQALRESLKANRRKMDAATANGAFDEAQVSALAAEKGNLSAQATVERARVKSQIFAILTDEQKAKASEMRSRMKDRFKGKMKDRKGGVTAPGESEL
jgi:periplasmic protein CpxP/Spy